MTEISEAGAKTWIEAVKGGDRSLVDELYLNHRDEFVQWALTKYLLSKDDLLDIYQNAIIALYENVVGNKINDLKSNVKTYLFGIAKNMILKLLRKSKTETMHADSVSEHWVSQYLEGDEEMEAMWAKTKRQMEKMEEPCRSILELFYFHNYSLQIIAKVMDYQNKDVVKTQKSRCLKSLKNNILHPQNNN